MLADTSANAKELENHKERREIQDANTNGEGKSSRYSKTLMQKTLYYAKKLDDGTILRVSTTQNSVIMVLLGLIYPMIIIIILALILSLVLSNRVSKKIIKPINDIDLENPSENITYEELTPLLKKISSQNKTIRKQFKEAKQRQEEFKLITENMSEGLLVIDKNANVLSYNESALRLLEITDVTAGSVLTFNRSKGFRECVEKALTGQRCENEISIEDNTYSVIANPVYVNEKIIGAVIVILDITENVKREQLRREFTSNVSHELKTPISIISGYAEGLKLNVSPESKEEYCNTIIDESQRMNRLVLSILELSRYESGQIPLNKESFDISSFCAESLDRIFAGRDIETENKIPEGTQITADPLQTEQVLKAYLENAAAHTPDGGKVWTESAVSGDTVRISVFNTGSHVDEEVMPQIWQSFFRGDKSHKRDSARFGLGLSIVSAIMKLHGHKCGVYNTDCGVCFWFEADKGSSDNNC